MIETHERWCACVDCMKAKGRPLNEKPIERVQPDGETLSKDVTSPVQEIVKIFN